jgi:RNA polymerase sigma factor (sigma-70 family)
MINNDLEKNFEKITGLNFDTFYHKYRPKLVWYLTKFTKDQEKSEDFADDAFTQALLKIDNYNKEKSQVHTWLYKIGQNMVKKDFKDRKRMMVVSLDKENSDNLNLINIIPHKSDSIDIENELILNEKVNIVKDTIFELPEKYKKVMILRELENKPYLEIAELCTKDYPFSITDKDSINFQNAKDFLDIYINNKGDKSCFVTFTYKDGKNIEQIQLEIKAGEELKIDKDEISGVSKVNLDTESDVIGMYRATTNLSTIKSQISKGRQLIQSLVNKKFKYIEENGLDKEI